MKSNALRDELHDFCVCLGLTR